MAKWTGIFKVNGVTVPAPDNYEQTISDLTTPKSGRTLDGKMHKNVVATKSSIPLKWSGLDWKKAAELAKAVEGKNSVTVQYMDVRMPYKMTTATIYIGDRVCTPSEFSTDGTVEWDIEFSEIEV